MGSLLTKSVGPGLIFGLAGLHRLPFPWERRELLQSAVDVGFRAFDVAPAYGNGLDETELGLALKGRRDAVSITTKFGIPAPAYGEHCRFAFTLVRGVDKFVNPSYAKRLTTRQFGGGELVRSLEGSLRRLRTDHVDRLLLHEPLAPISEAVLEEIVDTAKQMKNRGMIGAFGVAGSLNLMGTLAASPPIEVVQAPIAEILRADIPAGRKAVGYAVYRAFKEQSGITDFELFVTELRRSFPGVELIVATTKVSTLRSFKGILG